MEDRIRKARRLYRQMTPTAIVISELKAGGKCWSSSDNQNLIHKMLLVGDVFDERYPVANDYRARFIRLLSKELEENEDCEEVIEPILKDLNKLLCHAYSATSLVPHNCYVSFDCPCFHAKCGDDSNIVSDHYTLTMRIAPQENGVGLRLWEAAFVLSDYILQDHTVVENRHVIELGSGVGLVGLISAYSLKAQQVTMTDCDVNVLSFLYHNVQINYENSIASARDGSGNNRTSISVRSLDWTQPNDYQDIFSSASDNDENESKLTVLAADCIYDRQVVPSFVQVLHSALSCGYKDTIVLVASTLRDPVTYEFFLDELSRQGLERMEVRVPQLPWYISPFYCSNREAVRISRIVMKKNPSLEG